MTAAAAALRAARPTAVNLAWGVDEVLDAWRARRRRRPRSPAASAIAAADVAANRALGAHGAALLPPVASRAHALQRRRARVRGLRHRARRRSAPRTSGGQVVTVWVDETRPVLQGARLTAWELDRLGIPFRVIVDAAAGSLFAAGAVDAVVVGADRVAANGDVANKIGTYPLAVLARAHDVPFYVAAPTTTDRPRDRRRAPTSRSSCGTTPRWPAPPGARVVPAGAAVHNPAFDVTPARLVTALITERGVLHAPDAAGIAAHPRA